MSSNELDDTFILKPNFRCIQIYQVPEHSLGKFDTSGDVFIAKDPGAGKNLDGTFAFAGQMAFFLPRFGPSGGRCDSARTRVRTAYGHLSNDLG